jgi:hypothetical protein
LSSRSAERVQSFNVIILEYASNCETPTGQVFLLHSFHICSDEGANRRITGLHPHRYIREDRTHTGEGLALRCPLRFVYSIAQSAQISLRKKCRRRYETHRRTEIIASYPK